MIYSRYSYAADVARGRRVLELGCGSGQGFGVVGQAASQLVGGDLVFPVQAGWGMRWVRRKLEALGLVPRTLRGRARLKRLVYGKLERLPPELPAGFAKVYSRVQLAGGPATGFKVIYVTGRKQSSRP